MILSIDQIRNSLAGSDTQQLILYLLQLSALLFFFLSCVAGYRFLDLFVCLFAGILGAAAGYWGGSILLLPLLLRAVLILVLAAGFFCLAQKFSYAASVLLCGLLTFLLIYLLLERYYPAVELMIHLSVSCAGAILAAFLTYKLQKVTVILVTSAAGAYFSWITACTLFQIYYHKLIYQSSFLLIAAAGILIQFLFTARNT